MPKVMDKLASFRPESLLRLRPLLWPGSPWQRSGRLNACPTGPCKSLEFSGGAGVAKTGVPSGSCESARRLRPTPKAKACATSACVCGVRRLLPQAATPSGIPLNLALFLPGRIARRSVVPGPRVGRTPWSAAGPLAGPLEFRKSLQTRAAAWKPDSAGHSGANDQIGFVLASPFRADDPSESEAPSGQAPLRRKANPAGQPLPCGRGSERGRGAGQTKCPDGSARSSSG
jgi:hypothetical protein